MSSSHAFRLEGGRERLSEKTVGDWPSEKIT